MFSREDDVGWSQSTVFKKAFSVDVEIEFVGVWYVPFFLYDTFPMQLMHDVGIQSPLWG